MKKTLTFLVLTIVLATFVQKSNAVVPEADEIEVRDTVDASELEAPAVPQIPFEALDSLTVSRFEDRYVVVYKDGMCGVYDLEKEENVTLIEYNTLDFGYRKDFEKRRFIFFRFRQGRHKGVLGISEDTNRFVKINISK